MFGISTRQYRELAGKNGMGSFVPDESFLISAALGWAVASVAFQASILVEILKDVPHSRPKMKPGRPEKQQLSPVQR